MRRPALRHGDADDQRGLRAHLGRAGRARPGRDYWPTLIGRVKAAHPDLLFIAEAYWDMEWTLQQQGFDLCYDKRLYDRLVARVGRVGARPPAGRRRLPGAPDPLHREPRRAARGGDASARHRRARRRSSMSTLQGARLYHDGQLDGLRTHIPVFLGRGPDEPVDADLRAFYERLLRAVARLRPARRRLAAVRVHRLARQRLVPPARRLVLVDAGARHLVVVNLADAPAQARVHLPWDDLAGRDVELTDRLSGQTLRARRRRAGRRGPVRRARPLGRLLPRLPRPQR